MFLILKSRLLNMNQSCDTCRAVPLLVTELVTALHPPVGLEVMHHNFFFFWSGDTALFSVLF